MTLRIERLNGEGRAAVVALERVGQMHPWSAAQLDEAFNDARASLWGAWEEERLLGYAVLYRLPFDAELQAITVAPLARRRGVAKALLKRLRGEAECWGSERLLLEVRKSNHAARALYEQAGFTLDGRRRNYYRDAEGRSEDALLMSKALSAGSHSA